MARPPIRNPQALPVIGNDAHLAAISPERLTEAAIRRLFASPVGWSPEFRGDGVSFAEHEPANAAVLIGLVRRATGLHVLLTQRTAHLSKHAGQVAFPGGRSEAVDAGATGTALREAYEEVGLDPARVDVLGQLSAYSTVTNFTVTPVVGIVTAPAAYAPDPHEVDAVFEVPLDFLMTPAYHQRRRFDWEGQSREFLSMQWRDAIDGKDRFIWGATAAMLRNLYRALAS